MADDDFKYNKPVDETPSLEVKEPINRWPLGERPREKLLTKDIDHLTATELLAILLGSGYKDKSAVDLARDLLIKFNGINGLLEASKEDLLRVKGVGPAKYCYIKAGIKLAHIALLEDVKATIPLTNPDLVYKTILRSLWHKDYEELWLVSLNKDKMFMRSDVLFVGDENKVVFSPKKALQIAINCNAAGVILAHNHINRDSLPSGADEEFTHECRDIFQKLNISLVDHIIVSKQGYFSFCSNGLLGEDKHILQ